MHARTQTEKHAHPSTARRAGGAVRRHPVATGIVAVGAGVVLYWLVFVYFGVQAIFTDDRVDESLPSFESGAGEGPQSDAAEPLDEPSVEEPEISSSTTPEETTTTAAAPPEIRTVAEGSFVGRSHPSSGTAVVLTDGTQTFLRFDDDFQTDNGPDLFVYVVAGVDSQSDSGLYDDDFVNLGRLTGNIGAQNYEVPAGVDLGAYDTVVVWCDRFDVVFGAADLVPNGT